MPFLEEQITLARFLYLLSLDTKLLKNFDKEYLVALNKDYQLIHSTFVSREGGKFTKLYRSSVIAKCAALSQSINKYI
jgi:hypothetical protein